MTMNSRIETIYIDEVAKKLGCSQSTVRRMLKTKSIPQPIKRKSKSETLRWRRSEIDNFLGTQEKSQKPISTLEQLIKSLVNQEIQSLLRENKLV
jgi:excisionase family DNA binding protein